MSGWSRLVYVAVLVAMLALPLGCGRSEALPTPIPRLAQITRDLPSPEPTAEPSATPAPPHAPRLLEATPAPGQELSLGEPIVLSFDQPMDSESVEGAFEISPNVEGTFQWPDSATLHFLPHEDALVRDAEYRITVKTGARSLQGLALNREITFRSRVVGYLEVSDVFPGVDAAGIAPDTRIIVTFNRPVVPLTGIDDQAGLPSPLEISPAVLGKGEWTNTSVYVFTPQEALSPGTTYTVRVAGGLSFAGAELADTFEWSFTIQPPSVSLETPLPDQILVDPNTAIVLAFDQGMDRSSVSERLQVTRSDNGTPITGRLDWLANTLTFLAEEPLERGTAYDVRLPAGSVSASGQVAIEEDRLWSFTTAPMPELVSSNPRDGAEGVDLYGSLQIVFSAPMDPETTVKALEISPAVRMYPYWQGDQTELWVSWSLQPSTPYTVTLSEEARDLFGEPLAEPLTLRFVTRPASPSIDLLTEGPIGIYSALADTLASVRHINVSRIDMALYELTPAQLVMLTREGGWPDWSRFSLSGANRLATWSLDAEAPLNSAQVAVSALPQNASGPMEPGIYLLRVGAPEVDGSQFHAFVVTGLNITLKTTDEQALVWVTDLQSGEPVPNADLTLYDYYGEPAGSGRTDRDGLAMLDMPDQERWESVTVLAESRLGLGAVVSNWTDGVSPWDYQLPVNWEARPFRAHLFTDRQIYRPGQTVYYKAFLRLDDDGEYSLPEMGTPVQASLIDSEGRAVWSDELTLGDMGSLDGEIALAETAPLGYYGLVLRMDEEYSEVSFLVAEYRAPEFQVSVSTDEAEYVTGDRMQLSVDASFFFGGPVSGANVQWRIFGTPYYYDRWQGEGHYTFGQYDYYGSSDAIQDTGLITEGAGQTGPDGRFTVDVPLALQGGNSRRFTIECSVVDLNNQEVTGATTAIVHAGETYIGLATDRYVGTAGESLALSFVSVDTQGEALGRVSIDALVTREEWYSVQQLTDDGDYVWQNDVRETPVYSTTIRTDAAGKAAIDWTPPEGGTYVVTASARDRSGNAISSELYLWVSGSGYVNWGHDNNYRIELVPDQDVYAPGDVASILVPSPFRGPVTALLTIERGTILEYRVIEIESNSETLRLPIEAGYTPNVFVSLVLVAGTGGDESEPGYRVGMTMLEVIAAERELAVSISPDRSGAYQPGDEADFEIEVTDHQGNPVQAELTVQLVDLAVETLVGGKPPSIVDAFYRQRGLGVITALSLVRRHMPEEVVPEEGKGGGGAGDDGGLRTEFPATALWEPALRTDRNGTASASVTLPDNLTTWRLRVQAATGDALVGEGVADIVSNLDVMVRPALPRFLVIGDQPRLATVVHNNTAEGLEIRVTAQAEGLELASSEQTVVLDAGDRADLYWPAVVGVADRVTVTFSALSGPLRDAVRMSIPVYHATTPETVGTSGVVEGSETEVIRVPAVANPEQGGLTVTLEPSLAAAMQEGLEYLRSYPYDCIEQTVSRFLPNLATQRALVALGLERQELEVALSQQIALALQRVYALQSFDGGWGWWAGTESTATLTAYALYGLAEAREAGYLVDDVVIERAVEFLYQYLNDTEPATRDDYDTRATVLYALAEAGDGDLGRSVTLFEDREHLSLFARGYLAMALSLLEPDEPSRVRALADELVEEGMLSSTGLHWEEQERSRWQMNTDTRTTAIVLRALAWVDPELSILPQAVRWLTMARSSGRWESTQENVWAILALTDYMSATGEHAPDYGYSLSINGVIALAGEATADTLAETASLSLGMAELAPGSDTYINLQKEPAEGSGRLYYSAYLRYLLPVAQIQPLDRGIIVYREYLAEDGAERSISQAAVNDLITVKLTVISPRDLYYFVLEDPLPAGTEALDPSLATTRRLGHTMALIPEGDGQENFLGAWYRQWPTHSELRDEKLVLFAMHLPRGTYEYTYQIRCTTAGEYLVMPAQAYEMYEPDVFGRTGGTVFTIEP